MSRSLPSLSPISCGCDGCCDSCGCGDEDDDLSEDKDRDGDFGQERDTNRLDYVDQNVQNTGSEPQLICNTDKITVTAQKSGTQDGFVYDYSFTIDACTTTVGYAAVLKGPSEVPVQQNTVNKGTVGFPGSGSFQSSIEFTEFCVNTNIGNECKNI